ncbi:glycosyl hydrolase family 28-related protein [Paenibacillus sp. J5C2022]|uniref:glycosyl hydrolase family 28-related protein n=1 Tax=Paenibacillus sp. J5C2022 TaxID=2977129 RepID=UPI00293E6E24|nr:glycosyl hydrolase family 28-related protein [Paenibacillus sp. J5C2022]
MENNLEQKKRTGNPLVSRRKLLAAIGGGGAALAMEGMLGSSLLAEAMSGEEGKKAGKGKLKGNDASHSSLCECNVMDYGAIGDGTTDDTDAIQAAIAACSAAGGGVVCFPAGTYLSGTIQVGGNMKLRGVGQDVTLLKLKPGTNDALMVGTLTENVTISDMTLDGNASQQTTGSTVIFWKCKRITIDHIKVVNSHVIALNMSNVMASRITRSHLKGTIGNTVISFSLDDPQYAEGNNWVMDNLIEDGYLDGIIYNTNRGVISGNIIRNNGLVPNNTAGGVYINNKFGIVISNNLIEGNDGNGIDIIDATEIISEGNWCVNNNSAGIMYASVTNSQIIGNVCKNNGKAPATGQDDGISILGNSHLVTITGNRCFDDQSVKTQRYGIHAIDTSHDLLITSNILKDNWIGPLSTVGSSNVISSNLN